MHTNTRIYFPSDNFCFNFSFSFLNFSISKHKALVSSLPDEECCPSSSGTSASVCFSTIGKGSTGMLTFILCFSLLSPVSSSIGFFPILTPAGQVWVSSFLYLSLDVMVCFPRPVLGLFLLNYSQVFPCWPRAFNTISLMSS